MGVLVWRRTITHANLKRTDYPVLVRVNCDPNPFTLTTTLTFHPRLTPCIDYRAGSLDMWTDLDQTCVELSSVRFCGGQHLDHITAYSADGLPVLELCRRSDTQKVMVRTLRAHQPMSRTLSYGCKPESMRNPNQNPIPSLASRQVSR